MKRITRLNSQVTINRNIRADLPVPTTTDRKSQWEFIRELTSGESFRAFDSKERSAASSYIRSKGWKPVSRIDQIQSERQGKMIYRVWVIK